MNKRLFQDMFGWGFALWLIGYILGIALFAFVPSALLGWIIMPIGTAITLWVLQKKILVGSFQRYVLIAISWTLIAVICDYLFLVMLLKPSDGYYKLDVYTYYAVTLFLPLVAGWMKRNRGRDVRII